MASPVPQTKLSDSDQAKNQTKGAMLERFVQDTSTFQDHLIQISNGIRRFSVPDSSDKTYKLLQQLDKDLK